MRSDGRGDEGRGRKKSGVLGKRRGGDVITLCAFRDGGKRRGGKAPLPPSPLSTKVEMGEGGFWDGKKPGNGEKAQAKLLRDSPASK